MYNYKIRLVRATTNNVEVTRWLVGITASAKGKASSG